MFTKQHFVKVATLLDANHASLEIVQDFADLFGEDNERFDRVRFVEASTLNIRKDALAQQRRLLRELQGRE